MKYSSTVLLFLFFIMVVSCRHSNNQVLEAFDTMNERLEASNVSQSIKIDSLYKTLLKNNPKQEIINRYLLQSDSLNTFISQLKKEISSRLAVSNMEKATSDIDFKKMTTNRDIDMLFFVNDQLSETGSLFLDNITRFRTAFNTFFNDAYPEVNSKVQTLFNTEPHNNKNWLDYNFKGFPAIASLTKLTQMQTDLQQTKLNLLEALLLNR